MSSSVVDADESTFFWVKTLYDNNLLAVFPNFTQGFPPCGFCNNQQRDHAYAHYNLVVVGIVLPLVGFFGLIGNGLSAFTYSRPEMRSATNVYLCALACSDSAVILTGIFIFAVDTIRKYSLTLNTLFAGLSPVFYPMGLTAQTCSVYFTVVAAADCFVQVCLPLRIKSFCTRSQFINRAIICVVLFSVIYNIPHCFEAVVIDCYHPEHHGPSLEVCPDPLRFNEMYQAIYIRLMYSIFLAVGPLVVLIILNVCIIGMSVFGKSESNNGDTISLILVVLLFIACNTAALLLNIFEDKLEDLMQHRINYVVDLSNLLVVFNSSFNFVIYMIFSDQFRRTLKQYFAGRYIIHQSNLNKAPINSEVTSLGPPIVISEKSSTTKLCKETLGRLMAASQPEVLI